MKSIGNVAPVEWYRRVIELGYQAIFPPAGSPWIWHLVLYGSLGLVMAAWTIKRLKDRAAGRQQANDPGQKLFGIGLMAFAFLTAFLASMATLIVSSYFPPYAICYPSLLLALGLAFSFWFAVDSAGLVMEKIGAHWRKPVMGYARTGLVAGLPLILTITLVGTVTVKTWPSLAAEYRQVMEQNSARRQIYAGIVEKKNTTGCRHFILINLWKPPTIYLSMDQLWAMAGYFRWRGMEDVVCLTEEEWITAGRPQEQLYFKFDCAPIIPPSLRGKNP
jgi:hypothetical protein